MGVLVLALEAASNASRHDGNRVRRAFLGASISHHGVTTFCPLQTDWYQHRTKGYVMVLKLDQQRSN